MKSLSEFIVIVLLIFLLITSCSTKGICFKVNDSKACISIGPGND